MASTRDPDLHLVVDGVPRRAQSVAGGVYTFRIAPGARRITIASRSVVPREVLGDALPDLRCLGVPVHRITLKGDGAPVEIGHDHPGLTNGFHQDEGTHRWTDGRGVIPPDVVPCSVGELTLEVHVGTIELDYPVQIEDHTSRPIPIGSD